jgi:predicted phosphodiesterase
LKIKGYDAGGIVVSGLSSILSGPYLLAPTTTSMTVTWETSLPVDAIVSVWDNEQQKNMKVDVKCERGTPWKDSPEGICMYRAVLNQLMSNTVYFYKIILESGEMREGTFKTLNENPEEIRIFTLSDSHLFKISKEFTNEVLEKRPDFIIHSGDISLATGYQKDEYATNWFHKGVEFLKEIPAIYAFGNHDISPYYDDFFMRAQKNVFQTDQTGHNVSFNYGNTHFMFLDSNPWGLFEMNAVNSGLPIDEVTKNNIAITLQWLTDDLKSAMAQNAAWRILVLHHPYTDDFTNKHIVPIAEKHNVNLVIAGHLHYYIKNVSINPAVGAKTVYISQGSAQEHEAQLDYGKEDERILPDFPEIVAEGKSNYGYISIQKDTLVYKSYGFEKGATNSKLVDEVVLVQEEAQIVVSNLVMKADNKQGTVSVECCVKNEGRGLSAVTLTIEDNGREFIQNLFGTKGKERVVVLNPGEVKEIRTEYVILEAGRHNIKVGNVTEVIDVLPPEPIGFENLTVNVGHGKSSNIIFTTVEMTNYKESNISTDVDLHINNQIVVTQKVKLQSFEKKKLDFTYQSPKGGIYKVGIGNLICKEVVVEGTLKGIPIIKDLSGNGNHGLLRGTPNLVVDGDRIAVSLDHDGDYIEILDSETLHVENGYTGIVWANLNKLASIEEMGHNPLMVKGISTGWGATYLLRMCVERSGNLKWGTCHGITEYSWQGGRGNVGEWIQYTSAFDKKSGGTSYCNNQEVAETPGIKLDEPLRNWEGLPLFIGYSYIGHIIKEIGRPKYFTHLSAKISQARFYKRKLSQEENQYIYEHPYESGPDSNDLVAWLDFRHIETKGVHKTEWRRPAIFQPSYKSEKKLWNFTALTTDATIYGLASLIVLVEVSDDGENTKDSKRFILQNGVQKLDISDLPKAQYIRIITEFNASITLDGTYIPELNEYKVCAASDGIVTKMTWGTRVDWEKGDFEGAIGFEPLNRTKEFEEYTDVIHG